MSYKTHNRPTPLGRPDDQAGVDALAAQRARCSQGEHDETVAKDGYATYVGGRRVAPGTPYCRCCGAQTGPTPTQREIIEACQSAGLRVVGPTTNTPGLEHGVVVHNGLLVAERRLGDRYRLTPSGPRDTLVRPR